jgi:hypothetical protein
MAVGELTSRDAVLAAIAEYDALGQEAFLAKHGYGRGLRYYLVHEGRRYDSKAIAGVAYGYQCPDRGPLSRMQFTGGAASVVRRLERLQFHVTSDRDGSASDRDDSVPNGGGELPPLEDGRTYSWRELAEMFRSPRSTSRASAGWSLVRSSGHLS